MYSSSICGTANSDPALTSRIVLDPSKLMSLLRRSQGHHELFYQVEFTFLLFTPKSDTFKDNT